MTHSHSTEPALLRQRFREQTREGLLRHAISREQGGHGDSFGILCERHDKLGYHCQDPGLILSINAHIWGLLFPLLRLGSQQQQADWLPGLLSGERVGGHAITEPQAGSDLHALESTAIETVHGFELNGHKRFITNTPWADCMLVYALLDQKLTAFIICQDDEGVHFIHTPTVNGCRSAGMGDIILDHCQIPSNRQLGKSGNGAIMIQQALELERGFVFSGIAGVMAWQLNHVIHYSRARKVGGVHLGKNQAISHKIADMKVRLETTRLWVRECARLRDLGQRITLVSAQTKLFAAEAFLQNCLDATQILGAAGLQTDNPHAQLTYDALAGRLFSGSSEIQKNIIAALLGTGDGYKSSWVFCSTNST